ncbi:peroxisome proliferator-activated receptor gamma coactivator 1-beta [Osmerus eperlanus]|uniref:peroxisome proliferator-activated receptor gamma coactivator 1-beta n=1 Tax=Osmerus eperlanus TaxID=29151 RepID=UPI002E151A7D
MADCASLLDEELSSFVFSYLTEKSGSQYGEEEVCSDRLDADFPDIDLSQLDASDFDSVNCLSELHWCNDQSDVSPASVQYSTGDQLFEIEEENAALLAALTDSLDGMVEDEVGGLSVFPSLGEELEEDEEDLPLDTEPFPECLSAETEDQSLLKKLLLTPPNVPTGIDANKEGSRNRNNNRSLYLKPLRPLVKNESTQKCKARAVRPAGHLCTELHRHLTTAQDAEDTPSADTEDEEEDDEDDDSDSEEEDEEEEEEEESSGSEVEAEAPPHAAEPVKPQFSSEKELHSMVELIKYMHTYCLPARKQGAWERREREASSFTRRARPEGSTARSPPNCHKAAAPQAQGGGPRPRPAFSHQREVKANSLLRELLEAVTSFDVSKPYRLHSPPYIHSRGHHTKAAPASAEPPQSPSQASHSSRPDLPLPASSRADRALGGSPGPGSPEVDDSSFSVRRSRRLASFPSRFAKRVRQGRVRVESGAGQGGSQETAEVKQYMRNPVGKETASESSLQTKADPGNSCCHKEKRSCLCLPLTPKSTGDAQYPSKPFEQPLSMDLCGTAGLTPPTTPPHKPMEEELFKPEGKSDTQTQTPNTTKGSWLSRANARKLPEQTELYAQLRRMGQASQDAPKEAVIHRTFGDHDYCLLSLGESRKRTSAVLSPSPWGLGRGERSGDQANQVLGDRFSKQQDNRLNTKAVEEPGSRTEDGLRKGRAMTSAAQSASAQALSPQNSEEEGERPSSCRSPSPINHTSCCPPQSPSCKSDFSCENDEGCHDDKQRNMTKSGSQKEEDNCQVFYIHNLPNSVTQMMLRKRFQAFGDPEDCKVIIKNEERCGVIKIRQGPAGPTQRHRREPLFQNGLGNGLRRITRKRYIDLDEAGPGPVKSKYDALDFDTLLKEAQKSLHR